MPKKLHDKLLKEAKEQGLTGERLDAYVYGTMKKVEQKKKKTKNRIKRKNSSQATFE